MKFSTLQKFSLISLATSVLAASEPLAVSILTPKEGGTAGIAGKDWMVDIVVEFNPAAAAAAADSASSTSASAAPASIVTSSAPTSSSKSSSSSGGSLYKRAANGADPLSSSNGYIPFLNSPGLSTFKPGPNPFAPGLVVLSNTSSDPTQNLAGVFQLNSITNSTASGEIIETYYQWYVSAAGFGSNVFSQLQVFFVDGTAPAKVADPSKTPNIISNIATANFFIFGDQASNSTSNSTASSPVDVILFTPRNGEVVGVDGIGWEIDLLAVETDITANRFSPSNGYSPLYQDNTTSKAFGAGTNPAFPGLVVTCNATGTVGNSSLQGPQTNLAGLFQINAITDILNGTVQGIWSTWLVGAAFAGKNVPAEVQVYFVEGVAPKMIPANNRGLNVISNVANATFFIAGNTTSSSSPKGAAASASASASVGSPNGASGLQFATSLTLIASAVTALFFF